MNTITISQKPSNSGSIYDRASDMMDITISMGADFQYAVVLPSYYNVSASRHKSSAAAIKRHDALRKQGYQGVTILDRNCQAMDVIRDYWSTTLVAA